MTRSRQIREMTGLSRVEFSRRYNIPLRTLENWDAGKSEPPAYVLDLLEKVIEIGGAYGETGNTRQS